MLCNAPSSPVGLWKVHIYINQILIRCQTEQQFRERDYQHIGQYWEVPILEGQPRVGDRLMRNRKVSGKWRGGKAHAKMESSPSEFRVSEMRTECYWNRPA